MYILTIMFIVAVILLAVTVVSVLDVKTDWWLPPKGGWKDTMYKIGGVSLILLIWLTIYSFIRAML